MAETEILKINGRTICDTKARKEIDKIKNNALSINEAKTFTLGVDYNVGDTFEFVYKTSDAAEGLPLAQFHQGSVPIFPISFKITLEEVSKEVYVLDHPFDTLTVNEYVSVYLKNNVTRQEFNQLKEDKVDKTEFDELKGTIDDLKENGVSGGNGTVVSSIEPMEDDIPRVFFDEAIPQSKTDVKTKFRYYSKTQKVDGYAKFKAQGNSSMSYPKKNVTVKMYEDEACETKLKVDFKGWGKQSKHVYKANWIDLTHARNVVSARIWSDIVKSRSDYENYPTEFKTSPNQGAVDGFPIKVFSQGIYQGRYTLNIPKDAWTFNMNDELDNHCILCSEGYISGCFKEASVTQWTDEVHDKMPASISTRWLEIINFVMNSSDSEFKTNLKNYFYVDSLIDYLIYGIVSCGLDAFGKNQIYATYDGQKWIASMYDMDSTWGLWYNGSKFVGYDYPRESFEDYLVNNGNLLYIRLAQLFIEEIKSRYEELKATVLTVPNLINHFERFIDITPLDLVKEDYASTTAKGNFINIPLQDSNNIQQIRDYIINRYAYADEYIGSLTYSGGDNSGSEEGGDTPIEVTLTSITATYNGGNVTVGTELTDLVSNITVKAHYSDGSSQTVSGYELSGSIVEGSNTITVTYQGKSTTFVVVGYVEEEDDGIDYTTNLLANATYTHGYEPNASTGVLVTQSSCGVFEKITLPYTHMYKLTKSANFTKVPSLFLYDENDNFLGVFYNVEHFNAKAGYKCIVQHYPSTDGTDYSDTTLLPYKPSNAVETTTIDLTNLTWGTYSSLVKTDISSYNLKLSQIKNVNGNIIFNTNIDIRGTGVESLLGIYMTKANNDYNIKEFFVSNKTVDNVQAYLEEHLPTLIING